MNRIGGHYDDPINRSETKIQKDKKREMTLGFYYHIEVSERLDGAIGLPAYMGLFLDSLTPFVDRLFLFLHKKEVSISEEYYLKSSKVTLVSLGPAAPAYTRFYFPFRFLNGVRSQLSMCNSLLVRSPSPLSPFFEKRIDRGKIVYMIVGSYGEGSKHLKLPWYKSWAVRALNVSMHARLTKAVCGSKILVNSAALLDDYRRLAGSIKLINTTTLTNQDFYKRQDTCQGDELKLLFVGRIDFAKGLQECVRVCSALNQKGIPALLNIVGWELAGATRVTDAIKKMANELGIGHRVHFLGKKKAGIELFECYRNNDIYLLPSYHEGFPRTIWEALANSIPVVTTSVGSIPSFLRNGEEAMLVEPGMVDDLLDAVERIIHDATLRRNLIKNGYDRVKDITLDVQSKIIVDFLKDD